MGFVRYGQRRGYEGSIPLFIVAKLPALAKYPSALATIIYMAHRADITGEVRVNYKELKAILGTTVNSVPARALKRLTNMGMIKKYGRGCYSIQYQADIGSRPNGMKDIKDNPAIDFGVEVVLANRYEPDLEPSKKFKYRDGDLGGIVWWARRIAKTYDAFKKLDRQISYYTHGRIASDELLGRIAMILLREKLIDADAKSF